MVALLKLKLNLLFILFVLFCSRSVASDDPQIPINEEETETQSAVKDVSIKSEVCRSGCSANGVCFKSKCYCRNGFEGKDCSIEISLEDSLIGLNVLILCYLLSIVAGLLFGYSSYRAINSCFTGLPSNFDEIKNEVDLAENWHSISRPIVEK